MVLLRGSGDCVSCALWSFLRTCLGGSLTAYLLDCLCLLCKFWDKLNPLWNHRRTKETCWVLTLATDLAH